MGGNRGLAEQVRTGLDQQASRPQLRVVKTTMKRDPLDEFTYGKTAKQHIREFGCVIALFFICIAGYKIYAYPGWWSAIYSWTIGALVFVALCYATPRTMIYPWRGWMVLGNFLGWATSIVIVGAAWLAMFVPVGLIFKLIGKRVMDTSFKTSVNSYWEDRPETSNDFKLLERQF